MILEIDNEWGDVQSIVVKNRQPVERTQPIQTGDTAPFFTIAATHDAWQASVFTAGLPGQSLTISELLGQGPLVVSFYCPCWGQYASPFLKALTQLSTQIEAAGGQLVVFSNEHPRYLPKPSDDSSTLLVYDADNTVAQRFGVYSDRDPIWDRVSGISEDVYIPALYVVERSRKISYHFIDENFEGLTDPQDILNALAR